MSASRRPPRRGKPARSSSRGHDRRPPIAGASPERILFGVHAVREAWTNPDRRCERLFVTEGGREAMEAALEAAGRAGLTRPAPEIVARDALDALLPDGAVHQGVVLLAAPLAETDLYDLGRLTEDRRSSVVVVLDQVTDPHNVGAILRSAAAFGADAVVTTERNAPEMTGTLAKTASGAAEYVPVIRVMNLARALRDLQEWGFWCVGLAEEGERTLSELAPTGKVALVLGAEGPGLRRLTRETCDALVRLPTSGPVGSLNVSNAAAVALYETARRPRPGG
ncbi:23S rRNA (guanosine(2251)-2'-O)-methyltransferase RlmB [Inquilinus sp. CAU 1745]|uniref:23S rRNA (guanosine(2251)-2'-O)-methyltransferase RlmB n=1 Tax=Inquilinus sp. CAU 1745 TaxID=3140369 RepID=UPI00325C1106